MSHISSSSITSSEQAAIDSLLGLPTTPGGQALIKTGPNTFANGAISGGGFTKLTPTETPNGVITVFTFGAASSQPTFIISDNAIIQATSKSGTVNWTWNNGAKKATMTIPPQDDIVGIQ